MHYAYDVNCKIYRALLKQATVKYEYPVIYAKPHQPLFGCTSLSVCHFTRSQDQTVNLFQGGRGALHAMHII